LGVGGRLVLVCRRFAPLGYFVNTLFITRIEQGSAARVRSSALLFCLGL
jgi:hypothetical protein